MDMAAILVTGPRPFEQTFVPPSHGASTWNLASIGPVVSEEEMFESGEQKPPPPLHARCHQRYVVPILQKANI